MFRKTAAGVLPVALATAVGASLLAGLKSFVVILTATGYFIAGTSFYDPAPKKPPTVEQAQQMLHGYTTQPITGSAVDDYPASIFPVSGPTAPTMEQSMHIGSANLDSYLRDAHDPTVVYGISLGAVTATKWLQEHANGKDPSAPPADQVQFVLVANESRPNGGILMRFKGLYVPILGIPFIGATPQTQYKVTDVAKQYDGFADFPEDDANLLAVFNALIGIAVLHVDYSDVDPNDPNNTVQVVGNTTYITKPTEHLPLLEPFRALARMAGINRTPMLDAIEPALKVLIETGYDRSDYSKATPARPFSSIPRLIAAMPQLVDAVRQGVESLVKPVKPAQPQTPQVTADAVAPSFTGHKQLPSDVSKPVSTPVSAEKPVVNQPKQEQSEATNDDAKADASPTPKVTKPKLQPAFKLPTLPKLPKLPAIKLPKPFQPKSGKKDSGSSNGATKPTSPPKRAASGPKSGDTKKSGD